MSNKRPRTKSEVVVFEYTGNGQTVPKDVVSVRFNPSVTKADNYAFSGCRSLREVVLNDGLGEIGEFAFHLCTALQRIVIPSTVTMMCECAFYDCKELREVVLNEGLQKIENRAFADCISLQTITIPSTITNNKYAFCGCINLREVVLKEGIKMINKGTFRGTSLERITIPSTIIEIEQYAFRNCTDLREVVIHNEKMQIGWGTFAHCSSLERFKFPGLSTRLKNIIQAGQRDIEAKMDDIPAVEWRGGELSIPSVRREVQELCRGIEELTRVDHEKLDNIVRLITHYEVKEATTLFELALWRFNMYRVGSVINREACRIEVPGPVKDTILQYLR